MLKNFIATVFIIFMTGCNSSKSGHISHKQFQTVPKNDATLVQNGKNKQYCIKCGMDLVKFYKTSHSAQYNGKHYQYCSIHCLEEHLGEGIVLKNPKVVDLSSLKLISVADAHYVVGSSKRGTMTRISKYAFQNIDDAQEFQKRYGGKIMNFNFARKKAQEDFKHYKR